VVMVVGTAVRQRREVPTQVVEAVVEVMMLIMDNQAAPVSSSSKSHRHTMPHSHLA